VRDKFEQHMPFLNPTHFFVEQTSWPCAVFVSTFVKTRLLAHRVILMCLDTHH